MGDMIRVQLTQQHEHDDPIQDIFTAAAYGIRATVHGTTLFTPGQIVFNKDMILRTNILVNTELIRQRRCAAAVKNNIRENKRRIPYKYQPGGKVLLLTRYLDPKLKLKEGPYTIESVNSKKLNTSHQERTICGAHFHAIGKTILWQAKVIALLTRREATVLHPELAERSKR